MTPIFVFSSFAMISQLDIQFIKNRKTLTSFFSLLSITALSANSLWSTYNNPMSLIKQEYSIIPFVNSVDSANYIKKHFPHSKIGNGYNNGAYLMWELWPESKIFYDARDFPYRKWTDDFFAFRQGYNFVSMLNKYKANIWCLSYDEAPLYMRFIFSPDWKLAFYGRGSAVFVRKNIQLPSANNSFEVSKNITKVSDKVDLLSSFRFAIIIKDWQTANALINRMKLIHFTPHNNDIASVMNSVFVGMKAFYNFEYKKALSHISPSIAKAFDLNFILTDCYTHLAQTDIDNGNINGAYMKLTLASSLAPGYPPCDYNSGLINWWIYKHSSGINKISAHDAYIKYFRYFLSHLTIGPYTKSFMTKAQLILQGGLKFNPKEKPHFIPISPASIFTTEMSLKNPEIVTRIPQ